MDLELDHFFILTDKPIKAGEVLLEMGLKESVSRNHKGQGTSNRRFEFSNGMLEILYIRDINEANNGPAKNLNLPKRIKNKDASPFGLIFRRRNDNTLNVPFDGWAYQPDFFEAPKAFHIGDNSENLAEPLCIYLPFIEPYKAQEKVGTFQTISHIRLTTTIKVQSKTLRFSGSAHKLDIVTENEHLLELTLDRGKQQLTKDLRPILPLIIKW
ncbi:hypothetical protein TYM08_P1890 [Marinicellulosiphila megalodicopiae]